MVSTSPPWGILLSLCVATEQCDGRANPPSRRDAARRGDLSPQQRSIVMSEKSNDPRITNNAAKSSRIAIIVAAVFVIGILIFAVVSGQ